jgi:hypothetical protein
MGRCKTVAGFRCRDGVLGPKEEATEESVAKMKRVLAPHHRAQYAEWCENGGMMNDRYEIERGTRR